MFSSVFFCLILSCLESHGKRQTVRFVMKKAIERKKAESAKLKEKAIDVLEFLCSSMLCFMILWESPCKLG